SQAAASMNARNSDTITETELESLVAESSRHFWRDELSRLQTQARDRLLLVPYVGREERRLTFPPAGFRSYFPARFLAGAIRGGRGSAAANAKIEDLVLQFLFQFAEGDRQLASVLDAWSSQLAESADEMADASAAILSLWALRSGRTLTPAHVSRLFRFLGRGAGKLILDLMRTIAPATLEDVELSNLDLRGILLPRLTFKGCRVSRVAMDGATIPGA